MKIPELTAALVVAGAFATVPSLPPGIVGTAQAIRRLAPAAFVEAPIAIRRELSRRGCSIPQPTDGRRSNVISGDFYGRSQVDWAALCSRNQRSSILVFSGADPAAVEELATRSDQDYVQEVEPGRVGFSRAIGVASPASILEHYRWYGGPKPPVLSHPGIDDAFVEKASVVWLWHRGQWLPLTGAN